MTRGPAIGLGLTGLAVQGLLLAGAGVALPGPARLTAAFAALVLFPGWAFVALGARPPGGAWLAAGWAFGFGVAWNAALILGLHLAGLPFLSLPAWTLPANAVLWGLVVARARRPADTRGHGLSGWAVLALLLAVAVAAYHVGRIGPPMGFVTDTPDHVGTLRRMLQTGELFPADAFFRDAGRLGIDPRKGLWHGLVAVLTRLSGLDPIESWRWLGTLLVPFFLLNVAALGFVCRGSTGAALAAWIFLLTYGGTLWAGPIRQAVYAARVADQLALATAVAVLADLRLRTRFTRLAAAALGFAAAAAHVFAAIQFALVFSALALGLLARDRRWSPDVRRLAGTTLLLAAVCLPYLLFRTGQAYAPANVIHTEPQGLTYLAGTLRVVNVLMLWEWMGWGWVLVPLAWPWLWGRGRTNPAVLYLLTSTVVVALIMYNPLAVAVLQPRFGYLLMRLIWLVPFAAMLAWLLPELGATALAAGSRVRRLGAVAMLALALVLLRPAVLAAVQVLVHPEFVTDQAAGKVPRQWEEAFQWMTRHLEPGSVVLSDPATSYLVPMMTGLYVATLVDQHSSPNDSLALTRILDARDALDPFGSWSRTRAVIGRYDVDVVVLNGCVADPMLLAYWAPSPRWYEAARARFDAAPAAFERLADVGGMAIYRVHEHALDTLVVPPRPRPFVRPVTARDSAVLRPMGPGLPAIAGCLLHARVTQRGDTLRGVLAWRALEPLPPGSYTVAVRFDRALPGSWTPPAFLRKPYRKLLESRRHERYRFRADHLPAGGAYGVDQWRPEDVVRDEFELEVPHDVAAGDYVVRVRMIRAPVFANLRLADFFFDEDYYAGQPVGQVRIVARRSDTGLAP
jgi:hypothetical protein